VSVNNASLDTTSFFYQGRIAKYIEDDRINITILPSLTYPFVDETENGLLVGFEFATNKAAMLMQIVVYGDNQTTPRVINNLTIDDVLRLGRGLTPGDVEPNPDGRSKDQMGQQNPLYPWIARYKSDLLADFTDYADQFFVLRFTPAVYVPYKRIVINITNKNPTDTATIISLATTRIVFEPKESLGPDDTKAYKEESEEPERLPGAPINETIYDSPAPIDVVNKDIHPDQESVT
jgi:hypothetical protein